MNILKSLFGTWEQESKHPVIATYSNLLCSSRQTEVLMIVEVNSKTGKRRAYIKDCLGVKTYVDMDYVEGVMS